ncbi:hypothetical protein [Comamonas jiangduensis]|uniref:hypothetical protein n=1 Tax=Comamonas jiangduensis TaxID=1194168 RepID=UPI003BF81209
MANKLTLESVVEAIRNAQSLDELYRFIGPSKQEQEAADSRLAYMESIADKCNFCSSTPNSEADTVIVGTQRWQFKLSLKTGSSNNAQSAHGIQIDMDSALFVRDSQKGRDGEIIYQKNIS